MKKENLNNIKQSGFKTPNNYFNTIEDQIMSQISLEKIDKNSGFKVPDNYFDTIEDNILSKTKETKIFKLFNKKTIITVASIAAMFVLFFNLNPFKTQVTFDNLDTDTVEAYILNEVELNDISNLINTDQLSQTDFIDYNGSSIDNYLDDIDLEDFLDEEKTEHMKNKIFTIILLFVSISTFAQLEKEKGYTKKISEKLKALKVAHITEQLDLTKKEAEVFWPIYNAHEEEKDALRKFSVERRKEKKAENLSENEAKKLLFDMIENEKKRNDLENKYINDLLKFLPAKKIITLYRAEHSFKRKMIEEYRGRHREARKD